MLCEKCVRSDLCSIKFMLSKEERKTMIACQNFMQKNDAVPSKGNDVPRYIKLPQPEYLPPSAEELEAFATKLYQSPIEIIMQEMHTQFDGEIFKATQTFGVNVDKDELIKALQYDRDQYDKGFADGSRLKTDAIRAEVEQVFKELELMFERYAVEPHYTVLDMKSDVEALKRKYTEGQK